MNHQNMRKNGKHSENSQKQNMEENMKQDMRKNMEENRKQNLGQNAEKKMEQVRDFDGKHPLTRRFQYEYALYLAVSELFGAVQCNSRCLERLMLYYKELPKEKDLLGEMKGLVLRDVACRVTFPMMQQCQARLRFRQVGDGSHELVFSDGIYAFALSLDVWKKGHPARIQVRDGLLIRFPQKIA